MESERTYVLKCSFFVIEWKKHFYQLGIKKGGKDYEKKNHIIKNKTQ